MNPAKTQAFQGSRPVIHFSPGPTTTTKYFAESVLVEQDYLLEPGTKVGAYLKNHSLSIIKFVRFETGEGLEKRVENFAEEVQKQMQ